ncbi:MAG TPA: GNAT family N-acetyltransferase [Rhodocyclaceae bacterium]|nr:GNAT family N-acetyltransferase [Rhodocyclaceae bacterium]
MPPCINGLEPAGLIRHFLDHPPEAFEAFLSPEGMPGFFADFDLLTTADPETLRLAASLPGSPWLRRLITWRTCFFGTTASEYAPMPAAAAPRGLPHKLLAAWGRRTRLLIVKDIPDASPLLPQTQRDYAAAFTAACEDSGFIMVEGQALAYVPIDFAGPEEYLSRLSSGRRKDIRRKLKARDRLSIEILPTGGEAFRNPAFLDQLYALYLEVYGQSEIHFDRLTADFFRAILQDRELDGRLFLYRAGGELIGFNLCFIHDGMLIDKYVGFRYPAARDHNLYFVSWMENLAFAIEQGLSHYVAGWTDPEIKAYLGASFTFTRHAVYVRNPLLRNLLKRISSRFEHDRAWFDAHGNAPRP